MIRFFDIIFSFFGILFLLPIGLVICMLSSFDTGAPVFKQKRVGKNKKPFTILKFRTMNVNAEPIATHLINRSSVTKIGSSLRKLKLDELPQLINVLKGDMSLVGPRPTLFSQEKLIEERNKRGVYNFLPGITGLAQINAIDTSTPEKLAEVDKEMLQGLTLKRYFYYIFATVCGKGFGDRIK